MFVSIEETLPRIKGCYIGRSVDWVSASFSGSFIFRQVSPLLSAFV